MEGGKLIPSEFVVGKVDPRSAGLEKAVHAPPAVIAAKGDDPRTRHREILHLFDRRALALLNNIVIFIRFANEGPGVVSRFDGNISEDVQLS